MFNLNTGLFYYLVMEVFNNQIDPAVYILLTVGFTLVSIAAGYFLGSVNSAIVVSRTLYGEDIRTHGSGNAGLTNMLRTYGYKAAGLTLLGDLLKTVIAVCFGCLLGGFTYIHGISYGVTPVCIFPLGYFAGFAAIIGHIYPIYYKFKGGKGVLCTAAMALVLTPIEFCILIAIFALVVVISKYVSLGSVTVAILYPVVVSGHIKIFSQDSGAQNGFMALITILIAILIVYCHRENLKRISNGTERKISVGGKKKKDGDAED